MYESGSFRDRNARVFYKDGAVYRGLSPDAQRDWEALAATRFFGSFREQGRVVDTEQVEVSELPARSGSDEWSAVLRHERIPFVSYPYEWSFGMLKAAALLQLDLLLAALDEEMILKDSSAFNIQWVGSRPVFIDIASFTKLQPGEPWVGYRQFCQMFLCPLMLQAYKGVSFNSWLRGSIDGIEPAELGRVLWFGDLFRPGVFKHVYLQAKMASRYGGSGRDVRSDLRKAGFHKELIVTNVKALRKVVRRLEWKRRSSEWSHYVDRGHYEAQDREKKIEFVRAVVESRRWKLVWDLGCNTGTFSRIAAQNADYVVAQDRDHLAVEKLYRRLATEGNGSILPLINNLADPSPALGWRGAERRALAERGSPDLVLCLALIHHLSITANIPVAEFCSWLAGLGGDLVIEFVAKDDPMVGSLLRNKEDIYDDYSLENFENCLKRDFEIARRESLADGQRVLYHAAKRAQ